MNMRKSLFAILFLAAALFAQDQKTPVREGNVTIQVDVQTSITDFIDKMSAETGTAILYDPNSQRIRGQKFGSSFQREVPLERLFDSFRAILAFFELTLVPVGPKGYEVYLVIDSRSTNNFIKNKATYVPFKDLANFADKDGLYISTAIPVRHVSNLTTLRTALSTMISPAGIGRVHEVPGSGTLIVMDFAPTVARMAMLVKQFDLEPVGEAVVNEQIELRHTHAPEMTAALTDLYKAADSKTASPSRGRSRVTYSGPSPFTPRFTALESRNIVLVRAKEKDLAEIRKLVARLDVARPKAAGVVEVIRLEHAKAQVLAITLSALLRGGHFAFDAQVVFDHPTNALIIAGERSAVVALKDLIKQLDVAPT